MCLTIWNINRQKNEKDKYDYGAGESLETNLKSIFKPYEVKEMR